MWVSIKRFLSIDTPLRSTPPNKPALTQDETITQAYIRQNKQLVTLLQKQQETLDRIVAAKYDRPVTAPIEQIDNRPPDAMLFDVLGSESDAEFLEKAATLN